MKIDLNADVGEGFDDEPLFALVTSVNIACGAHAGDDETMRRAVAQARAHGLAVGAHPGYADRATMGRASTPLAPAAVAALLREQIDRLTAIAGEIDHVKPHGALYNDAATDPDLARAIAEAVPPSLTLVGLAGSVLTSTRASLGGLVAHEGFADRRYRGNGTLVPRAQAGAVIHDPEEAVEQAVRIATGVPIPAADGAEVRVRAQTICIHGDTREAVAIARAVRAALDAADVTVERL